MGKWFLDKLKSIIMEPIYWFCNQYQVLATKQAYPKIIGLVAVALASLVSILLGLGYVLSIVIAFLVANPEWLFIGFVIYLLYSYGISNHESERGALKQQEILVSEANTIALEDNAQRGYEPICSLMFQVIREVANELELKLPALIADIEMPENKYSIVNGITYYHFIAEKKTVELLSDNELEVIKRHFQLAIRRRLHSQCNSSVILESYKDCSGEFHDGVCLDSIEDMGAYIRITVVPMNAKYAMLLQEQRQKSLMRASVQNNSRISWEGEP